MYLIKFIQKCVRFSPDLMKGVSFLLYLSPTAAVVVVQSPSHTDSFTTPWTVAHQAPLSIGFPRQEYWSGLPLPCPGHLLNPGIETMSPALQAFFTTEPPEEPTAVINHHKSGDTKQHNFILLKSWRSEIQKGVSLD